MPKAKINDPTVGALLRSVRKERGMKSPQSFAKAMGMKYSVAGILRRESGALQIDFDYIEDFCQALGLTSDERFSLLFKAQMGAWISQSNIEKFNAEFARLIPISQKYRSFSGAIIPGPLQTGEYASSMVKAFYLDENFNTESIVHNRAADRDALISDTNKNIKVVFSEAALYTPYGSAEIMIEQLNALLSFEDMPHFEYRILPSNAFVNTLVHDIFTVLDDTFFSCESRLLGSRKNVEKAALEYNKSFELLWANSVIGLRRNKLIERAIEYYKTGKR